jgi:hypothetical protein
MEVMEVEKLRKNFNFLIEAKNHASMMLSMKKCKSFSSAHFSALVQIKTDIIKVLNQVDPFSQDSVNTVLAQIEQFPPGLAKGKQKYLDSIHKLLKQIEF